MSFSIDSSGLAAFIAKIEKAQALIEQTIDDAIDQIAEEGIAMLQDAAPYDPAENNGVIPGEEEHLSDSFRAAAADNQSTEIVTTEPIKFSYVTGGTDSPILPTTMQAMWWPDASHPMARVSGQKANPFHEQVGIDLAAEGVLILEQALTDMMQGL